MWKLGGEILHLWQTKCDWILCYDVWNLSWEPYNQPSDDEASCQQLLKHDEDAECLACLAEYLH